MSLRRDTPTEPVLFAGFVITDSEVGDGAWSITPRIVVEIRRNGLHIIADVARAVHLASGRNERVVRYTADTQGAGADHRPGARRGRTFLSPGSVQANVAEIERKARVPVSHPEETVRHVAKTAKFSDELADSIVAHFIGSGAPTRPGPPAVMAGRSGTGTSPP